jgi:hypothetical protein
MSPQTCLQDTAQTPLCASEAKSLAVKTLGQLVDQWMKDSGIGPSELARRICRAGGEATYQDIQHLIRKDIKRPRYLPELAKAMGTNTEDLLARKMPAAAQVDASQAAPTEADAAPQIHEHPTSLTREDFLAICANLSTPDWQLTVRLMVAAGILPGAVEVSDQWDSKRELNSGSPTIRTELVTAQEESAPQPRVGRQ